MKLLSFASYFFAGVFLTNSVPHLLIAITGRRNITPFGPDSSPRVNLLWSSVNFACGYLLTRLADRNAGIGKASSTAWQLPYEAGCLAMSLFGVLYSWFAASQK